MTVRTAYQGLLVPVGATLDESTSTYTEQAPRTGRPMPSQATDMLLVGGGSMEAGTELDLTLQRGGHPIRGEAGIIFRDADQGSGAGPWYGYIPPHAILGVSAVRYDASDTAVPEGLSVVTTASGACLCAYQATISGSTKRLHVQALDDTDGSWDTAVVVTSGATWDYYPCLLPLPSGRVLLFAWVVEGAELSMRVYFSDDDGATWATYEPFAMVTSLASATYAPRRIAAAYNAGEILVLAQVYKNGATNVTNQLVQLMSDDRGHSLHQVVAPADTASKSFAWPVVIPVQAGGFWGAALSNTASNGCAAWRFGSASQPFTALSTLAPLADFEAVSSFGGGPPADITGGVLTVARAPSGALYLYALLVGVGGDPGMVVISQDDGETWERMGRSIWDSNASAAWWGTYASGTISPTEIAAVHHRGRVVLLSTHTASQRNNALDAIHLGAAATVTLPALNATPRESARVGFNSTWLAWANPTAMGDSAGASSGTLSWAGKYMQLSTTSGQDYDWTNSLTGTEAEGIIFAAEVKMTAGSLLTGSNVGILLRNADTGVGYELEAKFSTTQLQLTDTIAASTLATVTLDGTTYPDMSEGIIIVLAMADDAYAVWVAPAAPTEKRTLVLVDSGTLSDDAGAGGTAVTYQWGHFLTESLAQTNTSQWSMRHYASDEYTGAQLAQGFTSPDDLFPVPLTTSPTYVSAGATLWGVAGVGAYGDAWTWGSSADFGVDRLFLTASDLSPRRPWRAGDDTAAVVFDIVFNDVAGDAYGDAVDALLILNANWRTGTLKVNSGGGTSSILSVDMAQGRTALPFIREGNTITVDTSSSPPGSAWFDRGELVGATVELTAPGPNIVQRRIAKNTDGTWSSTGRLPRLVLEGVDDASDPTSGTCTIWSRSALILIRRTGTNTRRGYELTIDAQDTVDGDLSAKLLPGEVVVFGTPVDGTVQRVTEAPIEISEAADGSFDSARSLGPVRRRLQASWTSGIAEHAISGAAPSPTVYEVTSSSNAIAAAALGGDGRVMEGLVVELAGLASPVCLVRYLPQGDPGGSGAADVTLMTSPRLFLPALMSGPVQVDEVQDAVLGPGGEFTGKLVRGGSVELVELV